MDVLKNYLDGLFLSVAPTDEVMRIKEELLSNMEDRYDELISDGINHNQAIGTVISAFGTIDELLEELELEEIRELYDEDGHTPPIMTKDVAINYLKTKQKLAFQIGIGVALILLGLSMMFVSTALFQPNGEEIGTGILLVFVAIGVGLLVSGGMSSSNYDNFDNGFILSQSVRQFIEAKKEAFRSSYRIGITLGVVLCVASVALFTISELF